MSTTDPVPSMSTTDPVPTTRPERTRRRALCTGSLPDRHPFVDELLATSRLRLRTRSTAAVDAPTAFHAALPPLDQLDVLVTNFGFESHPPRDLRRLLQDAAVADCTVVAVVHDLQNPHLPVHLQGRHRRQLSMLVDGAAVVATLSEHARARLAAAYDVEAFVLPHPPLAPAEVPPRTSPGDRVLVHLKSLRRNMLVDHALGTMTRIARDGTGEAVVRIHADARVGPSLRCALATAEREGVRIERHERLDHDELVTTLLDVDVLLLPYSHGTHSGMLELATSLGTKVVAPTGGAYAEQGATAVFRPRDRDVVGSMTAAVGAALEARRPHVGAAERAEARAEFRRRRDELIDLVEEQVARRRGAMITLDDREPTVSLG